VKIRLAVVLVVLLAIWGMKRCYADANGDDLWWILAPTASLVGAVTGVGFAPAPGEGYISRDHLFLIEKSCAGINFMIAAFGMMTFARFHRLESPVSAVRVLIVALLSSYASAVIVNTTRIAVALWLAAQPVAVNTLSGAQVHRLEGVTVYFGGLVLLYELVQRFDGRPSPTRCGP
jgi:exosortase K